MLPSIKTLIRIACGADKLQITREQNDMIIITYSVSGHNNKKDFAQSDLTKLIIIQADTSMHFALIFEASLCSF